MTTTQTESFVPLTAAPARTGETQQFRATVLPQEQRVQSFKPLEAEARTAGNASARPHSQSCNPQVSIQREGDCVTGIRIVCGCGQTIELACVYGEPKG